MFSDSLLSETIATAIDARVRSTMDQKLAADCLQNDIEDLIPAKQFIERVTKVLVDNPVKLSEAFMKTYTHRGVFNALVHTLKEHEPFRVFLKSCEAPVVEGFAAEYSANEQSEAIRALMQERRV